MQLKPEEMESYTNRPIYLVAVAGTIQEVAQQLYDELFQSGYSLLLDTVTQIAINEVQYYAAWETLEVHRQSATITLIHQDLELQAHEWGIIEPCIRAHCDLMQARLVEGSKSLGNEGFGLGVSEAQQLFDAARLEVQKKASYLPPFSFKTEDGN